MQVRIVSANPIGRSELGSILATAVEFMMRCRVAMERTRSSCLVCQIEESGSIRPLWKRPARGTATTALAAAWTAT